MTESPSPSPTPPEAVKIPPFPLHFKGCPASPLSKTTDAACTCNLKSGAPESVSGEERPTVNDLLNAFEKAACILHEANLTASEADDGFDAEFDYESARDRYEDTRQALEVALSTCRVPPRGWHCSRKAGHRGPCAARPVSAESPDV